MKTASSKTLMLSSDESLREKVAFLHHRKSLPLFMTSEAKKVTELMQEIQANIVILNQADLLLPGNSSKLFGEIFNANPFAQVLVLSDKDKSLKKNSHGVKYIRKPVANDKLQKWLLSAIKKAQKNSRSQGSAEIHSLGPLLGNSSAMRIVFEQLKKAAGSDIPILLVGETGTGKDLAALLIHQLSVRKDNPFVPVNLGALPASLIASELFGHEKGSFTGAGDMQPGKFEIAQNGTIFLDEIETVEEKVQVSLLRLLEMQKFNRLGGNTSVKNNARLIVASNENLENLVEKALFRRDLYYRLDVFRIELPALRQRENDIEILAKKFLQNYSDAFGKDIKNISKNCFQVFQAYDWPGNVRELKNVIQRAALVCEDEEIDVEHLPTRFHERNFKEKKHFTTFEIGTPLKEVEKRMILSALEIANNSRTQTARILGISRRVLYNKLKKFNIVS